MDELTRQVAHDIGEIARLQAALAEAQQRLQRSSRLGHTCCHFFPEPVCLGWHERAALQRRVEALEKAAEHFRYCDLAGGELEHRCESCTEGEAALRGPQK